MHSLVHSHVRTILVCCTKFSYCKRGTLRKSVHILAQYNFLYRWAGINKARVKWQCRSVWYPLAANFSSGVGTCTGIVLSQFIHLLCASVLPQFSALELRVPMGTCPGQYSKWCIFTLQIFICWRSLEHSYYTVNLLNAQQIQCSPLLLIATNFKCFIFPTLPFFRSQHDTWNNSISKQQWLSC